MANTDHPKWGGVHNSDLKTDSPWAGKVVLSLDGGGVRGYASLLILKELLRSIKAIETSHATEPHHSSASYSWCKDSVDVPNGQFLLHHYVDYFVGTSTGGLSAIALGRLHKSVPDVLNLYKTFGDRVFAHPRKRSMKGFRVPKYSTKVFEDVLKSATIPQNTPPDRVDKQAKRVCLRNVNPDSARTVVVSWGGEVQEEMYLFRSYDNAARNSRFRSQGPNPRIDSIESWSASDIPVWKIGRATSAAPGYFEPMDIGKARFQDGVLASAINPVKVAYDEVKLDSSREPRLVVSIGTGSRDVEPKQRSQPTGFLSSLRNMAQLRETFKIKMQVARKTHQDFEELCREKKLKYFRFDVPADTDLGDIRLGEWRGEGGSVTTKRMDEIVDTYVEEQRDRINKCAQELVDVRRLRQATVRWERFADDRVYYRCPIAYDVGTDDEECNERRSFDNRVQLRQHAIEHHGFVWPVKCVRSGPAASSKNPFVNKTLAEYCCYWGHCETEGKVSAFDKREDFLTHLKDVHKIENPRVLSHDELERWLDKGRDMLHEDYALKRQETSFTKG